MPYETLKFYCNEGLVLNVKRDANNRCVFDDRDSAWVKSRTCLKNCGMRIREMKQYIGLCYKGRESIPKRKVILEGKRQELLKRMAELQSCVEDIDWKQLFYDDMLSGMRPY